MKTKKKKLLNEIEFDYICEFACFGIPLIDSVLIFIHLNVIFLGVPFIKLILS